MEYILQSWVKMFTNAAAYCGHEVTAKKCFMESGCDITMLIFLLFLTSQKSISLKMSHVSAKTVVWAGSFSPRKKTGHFFGAMTLDRMTSAKMTFY
jgi:hypothetical protein